MPFRERKEDKKRTASVKNRRLSWKKTAATYSPTLRAVPLAWPGLTSLFGMGRGGTPAL